MTQTVGYFENNVTYMEGPFVMVNANGYRIEAELKGHYCPVLPDVSIYLMLEKEKDKAPGKAPDTVIAPLVDWLNEQVKKGRIILEGNQWVCPEYPWKIN